MFIVRGRRQKSGDFSGRRREPCRDDVQRHAVLKCRRKQHMDLGVRTQEEENVSVAGTDPHPWNRLFEN